jgi:hypothetical protein
MIGIHAQSELQRYQAHFAYLTAGELYTGLSKNLYLHVLYDFDFFRKRK